MLLSIYLNLCRNLLKFRKKSNFRKKLQKIQVFGKKFKKKISKFSEKIAKISKFLEQTTNFWKELQKS